MTFRAASLDQLAALWELAYRNGCPAVGRAITDEVVRRLDASRNRINKGSTL